MEDAIALVFDSLINEEITNEQAQKYLLDYYKHIEKYVNIGKREVSLGEQLGFPLMGVYKGYYERRGEFEEL